MNIHYKLRVYKLGVGSVVHSPTRCLVSEDKKTPKMKYQQLVIVTLFAMVTVCTAHIGGGQIDLEKVGPQVYCGRNLARTLALLCYSDEPEKRSESGTMYNAILSPYYKEHEVSWPWLAPHLARSMDYPSWGKRAFTGVVNECCLKPCTLNVLLSYCSV